MMISDLSQRIDIRRKSLGADFGFGEPTVTEVSILSTVACIKEVKRTQKVMQELDLEVVTYKMTIRYRSAPSIQKGDIIVWRGARLKVLTNATLIDIDKRKFLEAIIVQQDG